LESKIMLKKFALACCALLLSPVVAFAEEMAPQLSSAEADAVAKAGTFGLMLWNYDQAAWHGTDALLEDIKDPNAAGISGWVVTPVADGWQVTFYANEADRKIGIWSAVWTGSKIIKAAKLSGDDRVLSSAQARLIAARGAAPLDKLQSCSNKPFNTVVMPGDTADAPIRVYFLTPQTDANIVPLGGHNLIEMKDGKAISQRQFTKSCIDLSRPPAKKGGSTPQALMISHMLDPTPTEIHVFSVYAARLPIYVSTTQNNILWEAGIKDGKPQIVMIRRN
jgi:hypothetical protein